jgi:hypothetical protein
LSNPLGLLVVVGAMIAEVQIINPNPYTLYYMNAHGFFLGLLAFLFGFLFVISGRAFWEMMLKWRWLFLASATILLIFRLTYFKQLSPNYLIVIESCSWIFSAFAFSYKYLNHPSKALNYLSQAAYPVYILHMIFLYLGSMLIFPLNIPAALQFMLVLLFTGIGCFSMFELIRRVNLLRPLFGLKMKPQTTPLPVAES